MDGIGTKHPKINEKSVLYDCFIGGYVLVPYGFVLSLSILSLLLLSINQLITIPPICLSHACLLQKYLFRSILRQCGAGKTLDILIFLPIIIIVILKAYICILYDMLKTWQRIQWGLSCPEN